MPAAPTAAAAATVTPAAQLNAKADAFDQGRSNLYTTIGTMSDVISHATIDALPGSTNTPVERVLLQAPGVSQDSAAASGLLHVRNDHANVQFRINGVMLPDGLTGFGSILDAKWIGSIALITGALPAEFGLRTVGLVDITTRADIFNNSGSVGIYGGSQGTLTPSFEYGGTFGSTCPSAAPAPGKPTPTVPNSDCFAGVQYYFTGRYLQTNEGIENPTPSYSPIHDFSRQEKGFAYMSTFIDPTTRLSLIAGTANSTFQIPNVPGQPVGLNGNPPVTSAFGVSNFNSALLNENQVEFTQYGVLALQKSVKRFRRATILFYPLRPAELHAGPARRSADQRHRVERHPPVLYQRHPGRRLVSDQSGEHGSRGLLRQRRAGLRRQFIAGRAGARRDSRRRAETISDDVSKLGWLAGVYAQDEWKVTDKLTINGGLRFDQMWQFVSANQLSPRISFTYKPYEYTTFHAGYARYFTPPVLVEAAPANIGLFNDTTGGAGRPGQQPGAAGAFALFRCRRRSKHPVRMQRAGGEELHRPRSRSRRLLQDRNRPHRQRNVRSGAGAQRLQLCQGINEGVEFSAKFHSGNFQAYGNLAVAQQRATAGRLQSISVRQHHAARRSRRSDRVPVHPVALDLYRSQPVRDRLGRRHLSVLRPAGLRGETFGGIHGTDGSPWCGTKLSADMIYGSGLRNGDANITTVPPYTQFNVGVAREFLLPNDPKPVTVRFDVVNLFDTVYHIRDGTGIGVFAPQFGPRRGYFLGLSKKI